MVVPYFVQTLPDGRSKAVFTVPEGQLTHLTLHPVLCRGAEFQLQPDAASHKLLRATQPQQYRSTTSTTGRMSRSSSSHTHQQQQSYGVGFLSTEYYSPEPEATAQQIAVRLASRSEDSSSSGSSANSAASMSHYFGFL